MMEVVGESVVLSSISSLESFEILRKSESAPDEQLTGVPTTFLSKHPARNSDEPVSEARKCTNFPHVILRMAWWTLGWVQVLRY